MQDKIGPYAILETLGQGGMGIVYRARPVAGGPDVALKTTRHASPEEVARIRSEIAALASIRHPGIVAFIADGVDNGIPWYAMELLDGRTMRVFLRELWPDAAVLPGSGDASHRRSPARSQTWTGAAATEPELEEVFTGLGAFDRRPAAGRLNEVLTLCLQLCAPLSSLHARGLVHRDLKPENVYICRDGRAVLMDLGLVAQAGGSIGRERIEDGGRVLGTLSYMAPEQADGELVDARADLYALGAILYELLTGETTVRHAAVSQTLHAIREEVPRPPSELVDDVPPELDELVMRLLAKSPRQRLGHADDVAESLLALGAEPGTRTPVSAGSAYLYRPLLRGRVEQRRRISERIERLREGAGGILVISGESGAGKTFLALEAASQAGRRRVGLLSGECLSAAGDDARADGIGAPLHPFRRFLEACSDQARENGQEYAERLLGARARVLALYEPSVAATSAFVRHDPPEALGGELSRDRVVSALRATLAAWVALEGPLVLVLDDLQWVDELSFAVVRSLDEEFLASTPVLVICTWRSDEVGPQHQQFAAQPHVQVLQLPRLDRAAVEEMVCDMLAMTSPPAVFVDFLAKETEGNPFFVAEYLRMAAGEHLLRRERGRWVASVGADVSKLPQPGSLQALVTRRITGLSAGAIELLELAAVLGRHVRRATLLGASGKGDTRAAIQELESRQILEAEEGGWKFVHDKLREAAFARVPEARRRPLHKAAAEALVAAREHVPDEAFEWAELAHHWEEAGEVASALDAWARAGAQATRNFSTGQAREAFQAALALATDANSTAMDRAGWESGLAEACLLSGDTRTGTSHSALALAHAGFPLPTTSAGWFLGFLRQLATRFVQAYLPGPFREARPERIAATGLAAATSQRLLEPYFLSNQPLQGLYVGLMCINLAERVPDSPALSRGLAFMAMLVGATPLRAVADRWTARATDLAEKGGRREVLVYVLSRGGCYNVAMGRWDTVVQTSRRARDLAAEIGDRRGFEEAHSVWGQSLHGAGRLDDALAVILAMRAAAAKRGDRETLAMAMAEFIENMVKRGRPHDALDAYDMALPEMSLHGEGIQAYFHGCAAEAAVRAGDLARGRALADATTAVFTKTPPAGYFSVPCLASAAHAYLVVHDAEHDAPSLAGAAAMAKWLEGMARLYPYATPSSERIAGEVLLRSGKTSAGLRRLNRAVTAAEDMGMPVEEAYARLALGRVGPAEAREAQRREGALLLEATGARDWRP